MPPIPGRRSTGFSSFIAEPRCRCRLRSCRRTPPRRWRIVWPPSRASTCCSMATPISTTPRQVKRKPNLARTARPWSCWASSGTGWLALERLFGSRALQRHGAALEPHRARPGPHPAGDRLQRALDLRPARPGSPGARTSCRSIHTSDLIDWKGGRGFAGEAAVLGTPGCRPGACPYRVGRAGRASQSPSCDGRRGVGFPKVDVGKSTDNARYPHPAGA